MAMIPSQTADGNHALRIGLVDEVNEPTFYQFNELTIHFAGPDRIASESEFYPEASGKALSAQMGENQYP